MFHEQSVLTVGWVLITRPNIIAVCRPAVEARILGRAARRPIRSVCRRTPAHAVMDKVPPLPSVAR